MIRRSGRSRVLRGGLLAVALVAVLAACSDSKNQGKPSSASASSAAATPTTKPATVTKTSNPPRTADYVGARKDVGNLTCVKDGNVWRVSGTITNPSNAPADYRIFTSFIDPSNDTRGLLQTDIPAIAPGDPTDWKGELAVGGDDLHCGLRVERTGVAGAPPPTDPTTTTKP